MSRKADLSQARAAGENVLDAHPLSMLVALQALHATADLAYDLGVQEGLRLAIERVRLLREREFTLVYQHALIKVASTLKGDRIALRAARKRKGKK